jgi:chromosome segregation ATPase
MSANTHDTDAQDHSVGAEETSERAEMASLQAEVRQMRKQMAELRAKNDELRSELETAKNLATRAHERIRELEAEQPSVSDATELEIALKQSHDVLSDEYRVAEQRGVVMAHYVSECGGPRGVRISDDTLQRRVHHELGESLAWAQWDRAADALASMAGDSIDYVADDAGNRLVINDASVLPD